MYICRCLLIIVVFTIDLFIIVSEVKEYSSQIKYFIYNKIYIFVQRSSPHKLFLRLCLFQCFKSKTFTLLQSCNAAIKNQQFE